MSAQFENSRCNELVEAAAARAGGKGYSLKDAPGDIKALVILTCKAELIQAFPQLLLTEEGQKVMINFNKMLLILAPGLFEPEGEGKPTTYARVSKLFFSDLHDLRNGKLDNPPF